MLDCHVRDSLIWLRYFDRPPTVGLIDISLSLSTISSWVLRWPMSLSASRLSPLVIAASPTTTAIRSARGAGRARSPGPAAIDRPVPGVAAVEDVVLRLGPAREAADAAELAQRAEPLEAAGQQLVRVGLVAGVPDDPVARRLEQPMEGDRQLDDAERAAEVAAGRGDGLDDRLADLGGELFELGLGQAAEVGRAMKGREDGHGVAPGGLGRSLARSEQDRMWRCDCAPHGS